jgi:hypothetical protein
MWEASRPGRFTSGERARGAHWIGGWVGPNASLNTGEKKKPLTLPESNPNSSLFQPVAYLLHCLSYTEENDNGYLTGKKLNTNWIDWYSYSVLNEIWRWTREGKSEVIWREAVVFCSGTIMIFQELRKTTQEARTAGVLTGRFKTGTSRINVKRVATDPNQLGRHPIQERKHILWYFLCPIVLDVQLCCCKANRTTHAHHTK